MSNLNESGMFRNTWEGIFDHDVKKYAKKNGMRLAADPKDKRWWYGFYQGDKYPMFKYDSEEFVMYSDYTPIEFSLGRIKRT